MHDAVAEELRPLEAWDHAKDAALLGPGEVGLEPNEVVGRVGGVLRTKLHDRPRAASAPGVDEPNRLHCAEAHGVQARAGHLLDRLAGTEEVALLEVLGHDAPGTHELSNEGLVLGLVHGAVEVVTLARLLVARLHERDRAVDGVRVDNGRRGVEEGERARTHELGYPGRQRVRAERARRNDDLALGHLGDLAAHELDVGLGRHALAHENAEALAVDGERPTGGDGRLARAREQLRVHKLELGLEQARRGVATRGLKGVGADELGQAVGVVRLGRGERALLAEAHPHAPPRKLQGALAARKTRADDRHEAVLAHLSSFGHPALEKHA